MKNIIDAQARLVGYIESSDATGLIIKYPELSQAVSFFTLALQGDAEVKYQTVVGLGLMTFGYEQRSPEGLSEEDARCVALLEAMQDILVEEAEKSVTQAAA